MPDISALATLTSAAIGLNNLIVVTPDSDIGIQPQNKFSGPPPPSLLFNYEGENTVTFTSDVTDHYIEDNTAVQDQIALKPLMITVSGYIGELNDVTPKALKPAKAIVEKLLITSALLPAVSIAALEAYNIAKQIYDIKNLAQDYLVSKNTSQPNKTKQQDAFEQFYGYWSKRTLFTVQTPWAIYKDCVILSLKAIQSSETRMVSEFEITFKPLKFSSTKRLTSDEYNAQDAETKSSNQTVGQVDIGPTTLAENISVDSGVSSVQG